MRGSILETVPDEIPAAGRPADMPWLAPFLTVNDARTALQFYEEAFGFALREMKLDADGSIAQAAMNWRDAVIRFGPGRASEGGARPDGKPSAGTLYVYCDDVDAFYARAMAAGATSAFRPIDSSWGDRLCKLIDPDGHAWNFAARMG